MALTPNDIQKMTFAQRMRGFDTTEVTEFLRAAAEELQSKLAENERLQQLVREQAERLRVSEARQHDLQDALLRSQKVADEIVARSQHEAQVLIKEAELTGDRIVTQSIEQATHIESRMAELRMARREVQLQFKNTLDLFGRILEADMEEESRTATVHTLPRNRRKPAG
jgi:cell division initiation protein